VKPITETTFEERLAAYPRERTHLLPTLLLAQETLGHVPDGAIELIARHLRLTVNDVEGVVTGYPDLRRRAAGKRVVRVCTGVSCAFAGGHQLLTMLSETLAQQPGDGAPKGITLEESPCAFLCALAPVLEVDGVCHGRVRTDRAVALVTAPQLPHVSPQSGAEANATPRVEAIRPRARLLVGAGGCGFAAGAAAAIAALRREAAPRGGAVEIVEAGCAGMCHQAVQVTLQRPAAGDLTWSGVRPVDAAALVAFAAAERARG
jgi:NADH:ubiquinone oxidoreductase subunit E